MHSWRVLRHRNQIPRKKARGSALLSSTAPMPAPSRWSQSANARESPAGFHVCHVPEDQGRLKSHMPLELCNRCAAPDLLRPAKGLGEEKRGWGERSRPHPLPAVLSIGWHCRPSDLVGGPCLVGAGLRPG